MGRYIFCNVALFGTKKVYYTVQQSKSSNDSKNRQLKKLKQQSQENKKQSTLNSVYKMLNLFEAKYLV